MQEIKIEKGIKMPAHSGYSKYPFNEMKVGDSFMMKPVNGKSITQINNTLRSNSWRFGKTQKPIWKFKITDVQDGVRIWRIK